MTKKFLHILALAAMICSCAKEIPAPELPISPEYEIGVEHDGKVTLGFNIDLGEGMTAGTRSLAEVPDIKNIYVAVFDATGYKLSEYVKANPIIPATTNEDKYQFTIQLKISDKPRTLHFIANGPEELRFGTEQEVIGELYSMYNADESDEYSRKDAYWQRLVFPKISPRPDGSDNGSQEWQDYNSMVETLSNLKLIRNFSKVVLSKREPVTDDTQLFKDFQILGMWFVNYPDRGSIAPYNRNTGTFGTDLSSGRTKNYLDYTNVADVEDKTKGNYQGFTLASTEFVTPASFIETGTGKNMIDASSNTASGYVYEREKAMSSPMYLIIKCKYNNVNTYYKVAMQDEDGNFYAMLRNFVYNVQIKNVSAAGYSTAAEALAGAPTGDISVNVDYQELPNISDGNARITVSATKLLIVGKAGESTTAKFWYKYEPDISGHEFTGVHNDMATGTDATDQANPHVLITYAGTEGSTGAVIDGISVDATDTGGNRNVTITTTEVSATPKIQTISIEGRRWNGFRYMTITRTIQLVLRDALEMTLAASPNTDSENAANILAKKEQPVVLHIGIEQDLPTSVFPLYLKIDPSVNSLTPDNAYSSVQELPARYGTGDDGRPNYWFEKTVNLTEYDSAPVVNGKKEIKVYLKTLYEGANATEVTVSNDLFVSKTVKVKNYTAKTFSNLTFGGTTHKVGQSETFSFKMSEVPSDGKVTIATKGVEPVAPLSPLTLTYKGRDTNGYWLYELGGVSTNTVSIDVTPYTVGDVEVKLSASLFTDASASAYALEGDFWIYTSTDFVSVTNTNKVNGADKMIPGQSAKLTIYIPTSQMTSNPSATVKVGGKPTSKASGTSTVNGVSCYKYTTTSDYTAPNQGDNSEGFYDPLLVSVGDLPMGSVNVPVYGIVKGDEPNTTSFNSLSYYLIKSSGDRYLYNPGTNNATAILKDPVSNPFQFNNLMKINGGEISTVSTSTTYYLDFNYSRSGYGLMTDYSYSYTPRLDNDNVTDFAYTYQSGSGFTLSQAFDEKARQSSSTKYVTRYMYDDSGTIKQNTTAAYWHIYPVTFVAP